MGDKKMPNVSIMLTEFPMSLKTRLIIDNINPAPSDRDIVKSNMIGMNIVLGPGVKPCHHITNSIGTSLIIKSMMACPIDEITSASFVKFTLVMSVSAFTRLFVQLIKQAEKSCHIDTLHSA